MRIFVYSVFLLLALSACSVQSVSGDSEDSYMGPDSVSPIDVETGANVAAGGEVVYANHDAAVDEGGEATSNKTVTVEVPVYADVQDVVEETDEANDEEAKVKEKSVQSSFAVNKRDTLPAARMSKAREKSTLSIIDYNKRLQRLRTKPVSSSNSVSRLRSSDQYRGVDYRYNPYVVFKTNVPAYAGLIANIGVEVPFAKYFSFEFPFYYSPYTVASKWRYRILAAQPEFRFWLKEGMSGHFFGVHGIAGWFNVAVDGEVRYQSTSGKTPLYGGGISYGYAWCFHDNWAVEFTAGVGYMHIDYDMFYNIPNGAKFDTHSIHYWGPTKFGINLVYRLN